MMSSDTAIASPGTNSDFATDALVPVAMSAVAAAGGYATYLHMGLAGEIAAAVGLTLFTLLLLSHVQVRRRAHEDKRRLARGAARASGGNARTSRRPVAEPAAAPRQPAPAPASGPPPVPRQAAAATGETPQPPAADDHPSGPEVLDALAQALHGAGVAAPDRPAPDWAFRPGDRHLPKGEPQRPRTAATPATVPGASPVSEEAVHDILKRLAAQIEGGEGRQPRAEAAPADAAATQTEEMLDSEVEALRATAEAMRAGTPEPARSREAMSAPTPQTGPAARGQGAPPLTEAHARLGAIAEALACERLDIYVEPILGLADNSAAHFEVSVRLRSVDGDEFDPPEFQPAARGTGLLPLLDALRVRHSGAFAQRLVSRKRGGSVFSNITGESLGSEGFMLEMHQRNGLGEIVPGRLVLSFAQADVRGFAPAQWRALSRLREQGFRFALEAVTDLGMDLEEVVAAGFSFVKLEAEMFMQGLPLSGALLPAADLCRHLAELGLSLVVGRIDDEDVRARVLGFGVLYGQGALFGGPRHVPVKPGQDAQESAA